MNQVNLTTQRRLQNLLNQVTQNYVLSKPFLYTLKGHQKLASLGSEQKIQTDEQQKSEQQSTIEQKPNTKSFEINATTGIIKYSNNK